MCWKSGSLTSGYKFREDWNCVFLVEQTSAELETSAMAVISWWHCVVFLGVDF